MTSKGEMERAGDLEERFPNLWRLSAALGTMETEDPETVALTIAERIAAAATMEEAFKAGETTRARDILNVPVEVTDVRGGASTYEGGLDKYAIVTAKRLDNGEEITITGGGLKPMTLLMKARELGALPMRVRWVKSDRQTAQGYDVLNLVPHTGTF